MFKTTTLLSKSRHKDLRLGAGSGYAFAAAVSAVPIVLAEAALASREYGLLFGTKDAKSSVVAITGLEPGQNAYVEPGSGRWLARYVPAHIRRYPFIAGEAPAAGDGSELRMVLRIDPDAPHLSADNDGAALFTPDGQPAPVLVRAQEMLLDLQRSVLRTDKAVAALDEEGLLMASDTRILLPGRNAIVLKGFRLLDEKKYLALDGAALARLRDVGALMLIHAHLQSLVNLRDSVLTRAALKKIPPTEQIGAAGLPQDTDLSFEGIDWSKLSGDQH